MSLIEFSEKYIPKLFIGVIGKRARILNVKPVRRISKQHKRKISLSISKETPELVDKIKKLVDKFTLKALANELGISYATLCRIIKRNNIVVKRKKKQNKSNKINVSNRINWNEIDQLMIDNLPFMNCVEFCRKYSLKIRPRTIRQRSKILGIDPIKRHLSEQDKVDISKKLLKDITDNQRDFIRKWANKMSRVWISKELGLSFHVVDRVISELGIKIDEEASARFQAEASLKHIHKATKAYKERLKDPAFREELSKKSSLSGKQMWQSEHYRLKVRNGLRKVYDNTDLRERLSKIGKIRFETDPRVREVLLSYRPHKDSKLNQLVSEKLNAFGIPHEREVSIFKHRFDFKVGNILLEVQSWYHLSNRAKANDLSKATIIQRYFPQYSLRYIWESEIKSVRGNERLLEVLGIKDIKPESFSLKDTSFTDCLPSNDVTKFLTCFHYLGNSNRRKLCFGLLLYGELIIIATFGHPVRLNLAPGKVLELVRLCRHPRFYNKNAISYFLSRCVNYIKKLDKYDNLVSFADLRLHSGSVYKASNWIDCGLTSNDYQYVINEIPMHKKTLYNRARVEGLTEREYAEKYGYKKVNIGCKRKFMMNLK